jgi:3-hydroxyacyl-CoA dehydrogenase
VTAVNRRLEGEVLILEIDNPPVNALSLAVRTALARALEAAAADPGVRAVVVCGARHSFPAGADIHEVRSGAALEPPTLRDLQPLIEGGAKCVIAAIEGAALGGGFELALACHFRVAAPASSVGLPEVKLGIVPGAGGTVRFTRLAGAEAALEAITTGTPLAASRALEHGLIDEIADEAVPGAVALAHRVLGERRPLPIAADRTDRVAGTPRELFAAWRERLAAKTRGPMAPGKIVDCIEAATFGSRAEALKLERASYLECRESPQSRALMHLFFAERRARKIPDVPAEVEPLPIRRAAVVGAGTMGGGIAMCFANAGIPVTVLEMSRDLLERGLALVRKHYETSVARGSTPRALAERALSLIEGTIDYGALATADIVIEAVFEDMTVKKEVFGRIDRAAPPQAVLATNTSTLDIDEIAAGTSRPQQVVGTHFFSPANVMKLLENVRGAHTSAQTIATVMALGRRLGKVPVLARNCDGFIGNRMLQFYIGEAEFLLEEGATPEQIDGVIERFGFAMGPLAVRDLAGNDVGYLIRKSRKLPDDERASPILERLVQQGRLGQKAGRGFYRYEGRKRIADPQVLALIEGVSRELGIERREIPEREILERLLHPLVNEGARILEEGVAIRASDIDVVYVNGYGFPRFRGGPMYWAEGDGLGHVLATMRRLSPSRGMRWRPAALLERLASSGQGWGDPA